MEYKRLLKTFLSCLMVLVCCGIFSSSSNLRISSRIGIATASLSKDRYGDLDIVYYIKANGVMDKIGATSVRIERYSGSAWVREKTFTEDDFSDLLVDNRSLHDAEVTYSPRYPDDSYRAIVCFYAKDSEGSSTKNVTTNIV